MQSKQGLARPITTFAELEIAQILGMLHRGDRQTDIAVYWQTAPGTINRLKHRRVPKFKHVQRTTEGLPPPGPYTLVEKSKLQQLQIRDEFVTELSTLLHKYGYTVFKSVYNPESVSGGMV